MEKHKFHRDTRPDSVTSLRWNMNRRKEHRLALFGIVVGVAFPLTMAAISIFLLR